MLQTFMSRCLGGARPWLLAAAAGGFVASVAAAQADGAPWKWQKRSLGKGTFNSIAVDAQGNPHVVFCRFTNTVTALMHSWSDGKKWFTEVVDPAGGFDADNAIAIDSQGGIHVAYGEAYTLRYAHKSGDTWELEEIEPGCRGSISLAVDDQDVVHIVDVDNDANQLRYVKQTPGGWESQVIDTAADIGCSLVLHDGKVYATYGQSVLPWTVHFATLDAGVWTVEQVAEGAGGSLAFDAEGTPHIMYENQEELWHAWRSKGVWEHETLVTASTFFGEPVPQGLDFWGHSSAMVRDDAGRLQLVFSVLAARNEGETQTLVGATFEDGAWVPTAVGPKTEGFSTSIAAAASGILHVSTNRHSGDSTAVMALMLKGTPLALSVTPKNAGVVTVTPTGAECTTKLSQMFYPGTEVTLEAVPAPGFAFVEWKKDALGTDPSVNVTLDKKRKVVARFEPAR